MREVNDEKLLELLELYMDLNEKKDQVIEQMGQLLYRQSLELAHYRNLHKIESEEKTE